jgi:hypothetical protein
MIKFQLYDSETSYQCHFAEISTFVVSIAHYMRSYFNYQALTEGQDFQLPEDAAYLNCVQLQESTSVRLYAKVGCMERETFTSTRLQLHVYTDSQCSQLYNDGQTSREHARKGYLVGDDQLISAKVSFKPPFYSCLTCSPDEPSSTFSKKSGNWYDDDYISGRSSSNNQNQNNNNNQGGNEDGAAYDDQYLAANDDVNAGDDYYGGRQLTAPYLTAASTTESGGRSLIAASEDDDVAGDDYYDDFYGGRQLTAPYLTTASTAESRGHYLTASKEDLHVSQTVVQSNFSFIAGPVRLTILLFIIYRPITMSFGPHFRKCKHNETFTAATATMTTTLASGICARESTSTAFGATRSAVRLTSSDRTNGQHRMSLYCL